MGFFSDLADLGGDILTLDFAGAAESIGDVAGHVPIIGDGLESGIDAFFGTTQADAQTEIARLQQEKANMEADRQRRSLVRQARVQKSTVRAATAVSGASSAANLAKANIAGDFASENVFIDETQRLGKAVGAQTGIIGEANQTAGVIGAGIQIGTSLAEIPSAPVGASAPPTIGANTGPATTGITQLGTGATGGVQRSSSGLGLGNFNYGSTTQGFTSQNNNGVIRI